MSDLVAIFENRIYGESHTELPPQVEEKHTYAYIQGRTETNAHFTDRMHALLMKKRKEAQDNPLIRSGWDLYYYPIRTIEES